MIRFVKAQLDKDLAALEQRKDGDIRAHISLLAKWMPSVNTTSQKTCRTARRLAKALGMNERSYRKTLSALRANICVTERYLTEKRPQKIQYDVVPAGAMLKYRGAFERCDQERFGDFMEAVKNGEKTINAEPLFPYEILRPFTKLNPDLTAEAIEPAGSKVLEALWSYLPAGSLAENSICMIDTSGSMTCGREGSIKPIQIAVSLGLYHAERCKGAFHNHFITFQTRPHLIEIKGNTLKEKIHYIFSAPWSGWTNLEGAFDLLLNTACQSGASQDELPSTLYIISDMEFNGVMRSDETVFDNAKRKFEACGYKLPAVVMINVNSWQMQTPAGAHQKGVALMSGASVSAVGQFCSFNTTPLSQMYKILMSDRYKVIHA